jgi:hypothetical protein
MCPTDANRRFFCGKPLLEEFGVLSNEAIPLAGDIRFDENGGHRAGWYAGSTVNAGHWIYVHLLLTGATLNTINGTNIDARQLLGADARLTNNVGQTSCSALASLLVIVGINGSEVLPLLGEIVFSEDRLDRASRLARAAVDALVGMDVQQFRALECLLVLARVNAVYRTNVHASRVLRPYAGFSDNVRHLNVSLLFGK